jgi:type IV secretion system protein VirB10
MICQYQSPTDIGSSRLEIRCGRILLGGSRAEIFELVAQGTDQQARLGITGAVDGRFVERYGTAFALAGISAFVRYAASSTTTSESSANQNSALTTGAEELSKSLGEISAAALEKTLDLKPIITVPQGTRMTIRPTFDWYIKPAA